MEIKEWAGKRMAKNGPRPLRCGPTEQLADEFVRTGTGQSLRLATVRGKEGVRWRKEPLAATENHGKEDV